MGDGVKFGVSDGVTEPQQLPWAAEQLPGAQYVRVTPQKPSLLQQRPANASVRVSERNTMQGFRRCACSTLRTDEAVVQSAAVNTVWVVHGICHVCVRVQRVC